MKRHEIIQRVIDATGAKSYLEIGVWRGATWNQIKCDYKIGVDSRKKMPEVKTGENERYLHLTSDEFFNSNEYPFDVIFIDGDHTHTQSAKDLQNASKAVKRGGIIIMHDAYPPDERHTFPDRCGGVWRTVAVAKQDGYKVFTLDTDYGVAIITGRQKRVSFSKDMEYWPGLEKTAKLINLKSPEYLERWLKKNY